MKMILSILSALAIFAAAPTNAKDVTVAVTIDGAVIAQKVFSQEDRARQSFCQARRGRLSAMNSYTAQYT